MYDDTAALVGHLTRAMHNKNLTAADYERAIDDALFEFNSKTKRTSDVNLTHLLTYEPQLLFHGSMRNLAILVQDDEQLVRHDGRFQDAIAAADWNHSVRQVVPDPLLTEITASVRIQPERDQYSAAIGLDRTRGDLSYGARDGRKASGYELQQFWESNSRLQVVLHYDDPAADGKLYASVDDLGITQELQQESRVRYVSYDLGFRDYLGTKADAGEYVTVHFRWKVR